MESPQSPTWCIVGCETEGSEESSIQIRQILKQDRLKSWGKNIIPPRLKLNKLLIILRDLTRIYFVYKNVLPNINVSKDFGPVTYNHLCKNCNTLIN